MKTQFGQIVKFQDGQGLVQPDQGTGFLRFYNEGAEVIASGDTEPHFIGSQRPVYPVKIGDRLAYRVAKAGKPTIEKWVPQHLFQNMMNSISIYRAYHKGERGCIFEGSLTQLEKAKLPDDVVFQILKDGHRSHCKDPRSKKVVKKSPVQVSGPIFRAFRKTVQGPDADITEKEIFRGCIEDRETLNGDLAADLLSEIRFEWSVDGGQTFKECPDPVDWY